MRWVCLRYLSSFWTGGFFGGCSAKVSTSACGAENGGSIPLTYPMKENKRSVNLESISLIQRIIYKIINENYFPKLEGINVSSIAEISRRTGLNPDLIVRFITKNQIDINSFVLSTRKEKLPKQRDQMETRIWSEGQRYQRRGPYERSPRPTKKRIDSLTKNIETKRTKVILVSKPDKNLSVDIAKARLDQRWLKTAEKARMSPEEKFLDTILNLSRYPIQNINLFIEKLIEARKEDKPFSFGCFACLNISSVEEKGLPSIRVNPKAETRMMLPKIESITRNFIYQLQKICIPFTFEVSLADDDPEIVYGSTDQQLEIDQAFNYLRLTQQKISNLVSVSKWSDIRNTYPTPKYLCNEKVVPLVDPVLLQESIDRRIKYYRENGISVSPNTIKIATETALKNVVNYANQGPIVNKRWDCLLIADSDPVRLAKYQSLLCPELVIAFIYPG